MEARILAIFYIEGNYQEYQIVVYQLDDKDADAFGYRYLVTSTMKIEPGTSNPYNRTFADANEAIKYANVKAGWF